MDESYVFLDLETTGLDPEKDDIIEIGAIIVDRGRIAERYHTLVKPAGKLPFKIKNLTGLNDDMLEDAPKLPDVTEPLLNFLGSRPIVGHNILFDLNFLNKKLKRRIENTYLDTMDFVQVTLPKAVSYRLEIVKNLLGVEDGISHRALDDAETAYRIFFKCLAKLQNLNHQVLLQIYQLIKNRDWSFSRALSSHLAKELTRFPSGKFQLPFAYQEFDQSGDQFFSPKPDRSDTPVTIEMAGLAELLAPAGPFAQKIPQFKFRPGQVEMMETVARGFQEARHMVIESGTGTGKSLAYLLPAIVWAVSGQTKVVIATHTINLQEQLWNKDLPAIKEITGLNFNTALIKGRNNYLCLRRWEAKLKETQIMDQNEILFCLKVLVWLTETMTGDRAELNIPPVQKQYWNEVSSEQDSCLGIACPWFNKRCFVSKARKKAETADLLIINHSLLLADLKIQNRLLPAYEYLVIDEAHHLEESATEQLGWTIGLHSLSLMLLSLHRGFGTGRSPGLFNQLKQVFQKNAGFFGQADHDKFNRVITEAFAEVAKIHESIKETESFFKTWAAIHKGEESNQDICLLVRVQDSHRGNELWEVFLSIKENWLGRNISLVQSLKKIAELFKSLDPEKQKVFLSLTKDIEFSIKFLEELNANLNLFSQGSEDYVFWIEIDSGLKVDVKIRCAPISVSRLLSENLFQTKKSVLLTSATLSIDGNFDYFIERIGLASFPADEVIKCLFASPFSYEQQSLFCIVRDLPDPTSVNDTDYIDWIAPVIEDIAKVFNGTTLVLFTSHKMLQDVYYRLQPRLEEAGIVLLGHKIDGGRIRLIEDFRKSERTVLFGASSFWEGIDLPGDLLKCVVIVRLPFAPPNNPVVEARIEELVKNKKDAFYGYTVPEAVIKLKQGFGRLIRSEEDEGVVIILDRRIVDRRYGRKFLNSLPVKTHFRGDTATVLQKISDWRQGERPLFSSLTILENTGDLEKYLKTVERKRR